MKALFDTLIILFLIVDALLLVTLVHQLLHLRTSKAKSGKFVLVVTAILVVFAAGALVIYGSFIEPRRMTIRYETLTLREGGTRALRLALISDLHAGGYLTRGMIRKAIAALQKPEPRPDAVLIAGDFVSFGKNSAAPRLEELGHLGAPLGTYGVLGNHDYGEDADVLKTMLEQFGIDILRNEYALIEKDGARLALVGADDLWFGNTDLEAAAAGIPDAVPKILLAHNPDIVYALGSQKFDAILAGHTHGGQIRLPWIGAVPPIPTVLGRAYDRGVFDWRGTPLLITQGIGETGPRARLLAPPEVMIIDVVF